MVSPAGAAACAADALVTDSVAGKPPSPIPAYGGAAATHAAASSSSPPLSPPDGTPPLPPPVVPPPSLLTRCLLWVLRVTDATLPWYRLPFVLGALLLAVRRKVLQRLALLPVGGEPAPPAPPPGSRMPPPPPPTRPRAVAHRTDDASGNDPEAPYAGAYGTFFGRNFPAVPVGQRDVHNPPPRLVADRLRAADMPPTT